MADLLLWRRMPPTDFLAINGQAAPAGGGGGAMHIPLGTATSTAVPIPTFLNSTDNPVTLPTEAEAPSIPKSTLTFHGNPKRRGGEWRITDQFHHRHPRWNTANGFPTVYDPSNRPIVFVIRSAGQFHVRFSVENKLAADIPSLYKEVTSNKKKNTGIIPLAPAWAAAFKIQGAVDALEEYESVADEIATSGSDKFDPAGSEDGRKKILSSIVRRQGQRAFRKKLLVAYKRCAVTGSKVEMTLEAAHITPYLGAKTNHITNGILLRADIHTLFDLGLLSINSTTNKVMISPLLKGSEYENFDDAKIHLPAAAADRPSVAALAEHMKTFQAKAI